MGDQHHAPAALPPGKTRYPLYRRLGGPQGRSGRVRKFSPQTGFDPRTVQPVASGYTDWAIPAAKGNKAVTINGDFSASLTLAFLNAVVSWVVPCDVASAMLLLHAGCYWQRRRWNLRLCFENGLNECALILDFQTWILTNCYKETGTAFMKKARLDWINGMATTVLSGTISSSSLLSKNIKITV